MLLDYRANNEALSSRTRVDDSNGVIQFADVTEAEQGDYVCTATNRAGTVTAIATLLVQGKTNLCQVADQITVDPWKKRYHINILLSLLNCAVKEYPQQR